MHKRRNGRWLRVEVLQHSARCSRFVCVAMFSETIGALYPSYNKYTRFFTPSPSLSLTHARAKSLAQPSRHGNYGRSHRHSSFRYSLPFNRKRHFIVLYTHIHYTTTLAVQPRNDDVSPPSPSPPPLNTVTAATAAVLHPKHTPLHVISFSSDDILFTTILYWYTWSHGSIYIFAKNLRCWLISNII